MDENDYKKTPVCTDAERRLVTTQRSPTQTTDDTLCPRNRPQSLNTHKRSKREKEKPLVSNERLLNESAGLYLPQIFIDTVFSVDELCMCSVIHHLTVINDDDAIHFHDRRQTMSNDNRRLANPEFMQCLL